MPSIYAADVQLGKPKKVSESVQTPASASASEDAKPKRTLSEETKQKLREARERKKQERLDAERKAEEERHAAEEAAAEAARQAEAKKAAAAAKRKESRLKRKAEATNGVGGSPHTHTPTPPASEAGSASPAEDAPEKKPPKTKRARKSAPLPDDLSAADIRETQSAPKDQPPAWFTKFVTTIMTEKKEQEGVKASKKELKAQGERTAEEKWADSYTRDRIRNAVDGHLGQMYSMIFR